MPLQDDLEQDPFSPPSSEWRTPAAVAERERQQQEVRRLRPREMRFGRIDFGELRMRKARARDDVLDDWMAAKEQSMLAGESQSGKSFLAIHMALCIASGRDVFGRKTKPGLVIYQAGESGTGVIDLRIPAWIQHHDAAEEKIPFVILPARVDLWSNDDTKNAFLEAVKAIAAEYAPIPLRALFIDTVSTATPGANENDGRDISKYLSFGHRLCTETGAHVLHVHHFPKGGKTLRGHGSLKADVDTVALVHLDETTKIRTLTFDKVKDGERGAKLQFELMQVRLGEREEDGKPITSCVVLPVGEKERARKDETTSAPVTNHEKTLLEALFKALDDFGLQAPAALDVAPTTRVVDYAQVRRIFAEMSPIDDVETHETEEAKEEALRKHRQKLKARLQRAREWMTTTTRIIRVAPCPDPATGKPTDFAWWTGRPVRGFARTQPPKPKEERLPSAVQAEIDGGSNWLNDIL